MSPTSPKLSGFKAPETRLSYLSSREEGVWLEEEDHMGYFMGMDLLKSPDHPGHSNPLPPPLKPNLTLEPNLTTTLIKKSKFVVKPRFFCFDFGLLNIGIKSCKFCVVNAVS